MNVSLQEQAEARAALSGFFQRLWPDPDYPCAHPEPLCPEELADMEQRFRQALRTVEALRASETGTSSAGL